MAKNTFMKINENDIIRTYKRYVKWCDEIGVYPMGFIPFKQLKFNAKFNRKTGVWSTKNV